jgi:hypothetical protein
VPRSDALAGGGEPAGRAARPDNEVLPPGELVLLAFGYFYQGDAAGHQRRQWMALDPEAALRQCFEELHVSAGHTDVPFMACALQEFSRMATAQTFQ